MFGGPWVPTTLSKVITLGFRVYSRSSQTYHPACYKAAPNYERVQGSREVRGRRGPNTRFVFKNCRGIGVWS